MKKRNRLKKILIWLRALAISAARPLLILAVLASCGKNTEGPTDSGFCLIYEPIYTSAGTPPDVEREILLNNAVFECLCEGRC